MGKEIIVDNDKYTLSIYKEDKIVHHYIKSYLFGDRLKEMMTKGVELMKEHGLDKWLSEDQNNNALTAEDQKWTQSQWAPMCIQAGWHHWAVVLPAKVIGQLNTKGFVEASIQSGINTRVFDNADEALAWLKKQ